MSISGGFQLEYRNPDQILLRMSGRSELPLNSKPYTRDAKKQWIKQVIKAGGTAQTVVHRFEDAVARSAAEEIACEAGLGQPGPKFKQNQPPELKVVGDSTKLSDNTLKLQEDSNQVLKLIHKAIVEKLNSYGIVLTVLASLSFVGILQPPGSFDGNGNMRSPILVGCFVFFSTLSFLITCTGLFAVWVGLVSLFRPAFFLKFETALSSSSSSKSSTQHVRSLGKGKSSTAKLLWNAEDMDHPPVLAILLWDNLERVWRLRIYLISSLVLCVCAFGCGAFAIIGDERRNLYLIIGAISGGLVALVFEVVRTLSGINTYHKSKLLHSSKWHHILQEVNTDVDLPSLSSPGERLKSWLGGLIHPSDGAGRRVGAALRPMGSSNLGPSNIA